MSLTDNTEGLNEILQMVRALPKSGGASVQADWNINDENASGYIKNRPFWTSDPEETELFNGNIEISGSFSREYIPLEIEAGVEYTVNFNGTEYVLTEINSEEGTFIGNGLPLGLEDNGIPFTYCNHMLWTNLGDGTYPFSVKAALSKVYQLDEKYIPDTIVRSEELNSKLLSMYFDIMGHIQSNTLQNAGEVDF